MIEFKKAETPVGPPMEMRIDRGDLLKEMALVMASLLFGAFHLLTWTYAIIAAFIGAYLGLLWIWTGNLLTPMITHAVYDLAALVYFFRVYRSR